VAVEAELQTPRAHANAACTVAFPIEAADGPVIVGEHLQALPARI